jgi:hypothetical protein
LVLTHAQVSRDWLMALATLLFVCMRDPLGRRHADTQKLSQNILAANDQRLMALGLYKQQQAAVRASAAQQLTAHGCGKAASASQLLRAADVHGSAAAWEQLAEDDDSSNMLSTDSWLGEAGALPPRLRGRGGGGHKRGAGQRSNRSDLKDVPFGMLVLEVLLDATAGACGCVQPVS